METTDTDTTEIAPSLIAHYRPLRLKAVLAATSVKGRVAEDKQLEDRRGFDGAPCGYLDIPFSD